MSGTVLSRYHQGFMVIVSAIYAIELVIMYCKVNPNIVEIRIGLRPNLSDQGPRKKLHMAGTTFEKMLVTIRISAEYVCARTSSS